MAVWKIPQKKENGGGKITAKVGEYKGNKVITLQNEGGFPFSFGRAKALLIIQYIEEIKKFVEENNEESKVQS